MDLSIVLEFMWKKPIINYIIIALGCVLSTILFMRACSNVAPKSDYSSYERTIDILKFEIALSETKIKSLEKEITYKEAIIDSLTVSKDMVIISETLKKNEIQKLSEDSLYLWIKGQMK